MPFRIIKMISLYLVIVLCAADNTNAQDQYYIDSILTALPDQTETEQITSYRRLFVANIYISPEQAEPYLDSARTIAKRIDHKELMASTTADYASFLIHISEYKNALEAFDEAIDIFEEVKDSTQLSAILNNRALALRHLGRYRESVETHLKSLRIKDALKLSDPDGRGVDYWDESIAASYWNIGNVEGDLNNYEKSNGYYEKAISIYERLDLIDDIQQIKENLAINLKHQGEYEKAIPMFKKSIEYLKEQNYSSSLTAVYDNLAMTYFEMGSLESAKQYIQSALALKDIHQDPALEGLNLRHLGDILMKENKPNQALGYYKKSVTISENTNARKQLIKDYKNLSEAYAALGNYSLAYTYFDKYNTVNEEVLGKESIDKINELEILYDTERKEKDLILEREKVQILEKEAEVSALQRWLLGSILILSSIAFGFAIFGLRQRAKRAKQEQEKVEAELDFKKKELATHALHLAKKNKMLKGLKDKANELKDASEEKDGYRKLIRTINFDLQDDDNWEKFSSYFQQVHKDFNQQVLHKYPDVTPNELRLMSLLKMNLTTKEMANILNISIAGVKKARQRLRKKMHLSAQDSLETTVMGIG